MLHPLKFHPILKEKIWGGEAGEVLANRPDHREAQLRWIQHRE